MDRKFNEDFDRNVVDWKRGNYDYAPNNAGQIDSKPVNSVFQEPKHLQKASHFDQQDLPEAKDISSYQSSPFLSKSSNTTHSSPFSGLQSIHNQNESMKKGGSITFGEENTEEDIDCDVQNEVQQQPLERLSVGNEINYKYRGEFVSAKITRARLDGTFDVLLSSGVRQLCVSKSSIRCKPLANSTSSKVVTNKTLQSNTVTLNDISETKEAKNGLDVLSVGSLVEARYRGKSKHYRATVQKVNNDGTYALLYEDGDREFRVARELIRPQKNQAVNSTKTCNQTVDNRRENLNKKKVSGLQFNGEKSQLQDSLCLKSRNSNAEGGDIVNEDSENNEAEKSLTNVVGSKGEDNTSEELALGSHIECRYRGKSKYYPATIKRVHGNGTYDLLYEDGDREFRVAKNLIKAKKTIGNASKQSGSVVQEDGILDSQFVNKSCMNPSSFNEGTVKNCIENSHILEKTNNKDKPNLVDLEELAVGSKVESRYKGKTKYYPAVIKKVHGNKTFDLLYDDGDREFKVSRNLIRVNRSDKNTTKKTLDYLGKKSLHQNNVRTRSTLKTDNTGFGRKTQMISSLSNITSDLDIEDRNSITDELSNDDSQTEEDNSGSLDNSIDDTIFVVGSQVDCRYRGKSKYYPATIKRKHSNDTYDLLYEDGDREFRVAKELLRPTKPLSSATKKQNRGKNSGKNDQKRDKSLGTIKRKPSPFSENGQQNELDQGKFNDFHEHGVNDNDKIHHDDENHNLQNAFSKKSLLKDTDIVVKKDDKISALVSQRPSNDDIDNANFQLFDERTTVTNGALLVVGSRIKARFQCGKNFYPGVITAVRQNGSFCDIKYDDGDMEQNVSQEMIQNISFQEEDPSKSLSKEDGMNRKTDNKSDHLIVGSRVEARFRGGNKFYPGIITSCLDDLKTYNILFDDGDREHGVEKKNIRLLHEGDAAVGNGGHDLGHAQNQEAHFQNYVGKTVQARFKGNDEWYQGDVLDIQHDGAIVIKLHSRGTFNPL